MEDKTSELLLRIMMLHSEPEGEQNFLGSILAEFVRWLEAENGQLFINRDYPDGEAWSELLCYPNHSQLNEACSAPFDDSTSQVPILLENGRKRLLLPIRYSDRPIMMFLLYWREGSPPEWVMRQGVLHELCSKVGAYLFEKVLLFKIASAKKNLQDIFDHLPIAISLINEDFVIERVNKAFLKLFGSTFHEIVGRKCFEVIHNTKFPIDGCCLIDAVQKNQEMVTNLNASNYDNIQITVLPLGYASKKLRAIEIYQIENDAIRSDDHLYKDKSTLYNLISKPLTSISLLLEIMLLDPKEHLNTNNIRILQKEAMQMVSLVRGNLATANT